MGAAVQPRLQRVADWHARLARWAESRFGAALDWGRVDCALLCFEAIDVQCGSAVAAQYRGRWHSAYTARRFAQRHISLPAALRAAGLVEVSGVPQRGDLVTIPADGWECGYISLGGSLLSAWAHCGVALAHVPDTAEPGQRVWRIL